MILSRLHWLATLPVTASLACGGDGGTPPQPTLAIAKAAPSGDNQTDTVLATLRDSIRVVVTREGAPASGVTVSWSVPTGQGSVSATTSSTGADGIAGVKRTLGSGAGTQTAQASAANTSGSPVSFSATALAGAPAQLQKTSGDGGTARPGGMVTHTVTASDAYGNPKSGVTIDWTVTGGGGTISPGQNTTGTAGTASATRELSSTEGPHTADAAADTIPATVTFTTTAQTPPATAAVTVANPYRFEPSSTTVAAGGQVTWTWQGGVLHNVTFLGTGGPQNCPSTMEAGATCPRQFPTVGTYDYVCTFHQALGMTGTVTVQ